MVLKCLQNLLPLARDDDINEDGLLVQEFVKKILSLTYDGAANNYAFSADPRVAGLTPADRAERRVVKKRYNTIEERRCILHRLVKVLEHTYDDPRNESSALFKSLIDEV